MQKTSTKYRNSMEAVGVAVKSLSPFLWVRSHEEQRFITEFTTWADANSRDTYVWSLNQGLVTPAIALEGGKAAGPMADTLKVEKAVTKILDLTVAKDETHGICVIMKDPMPIFQGKLLREIRDSYTKLQSNRVTLIFLSPFIAHGPHNKDGLPPTMSKEIVVVDYDLPNLEQIDEMVRDIVREASRHNEPSADMDQKTKEKMKKIQERLMYEPEDYYAFARALQGLTHVEVDSAVSSCLHHMKKIDAEFLLQAKKQIVSRSDILEYRDLDKTMADIGGMDLAKEYFDDYKFAHTVEAQEFGVEPLNGILLLGIPGCGKSQLCKAVGHSWKLPLIRMDVGKVMTGLVGGSEGRMREAIQQVEAIAPCILWIDEVEKALSGTKSSNFSDGGTMSRVFGTMLTAMEEGMEGVTIVATANDISALPPEFIRRFDETFFVDLPGPEERKEILGIHLRMRKRTTDDLDVDAIVKATKDFTGGEVEKIVRRAITFSYKDDKTLKTEHLLTAAEETKPLSLTMGEKLSKLREKAVGRFRYASAWAKAEGEKYKSKKKKMKVDDIDLPDMKKEETPKKSTKVRSTLQVD